MTVGAGIKITGHATEVKNALRYAKVTSVYNVSPYHDHTHYCYNYSYIRNNPSYL